MKLLPIGLILLATTVCHAEDTVFGDRFKRGVVGAYLDKSAALRGRATFQTETGIRGNVLKLTGPVLFKSVSVNDQTKYQLTFHGRQEGVETIEENPRLGERILNSHSFLPWGGLRFFDRAGEPMSRFRLPRLGLPFGRWHEYKWVFYPPMNAATVQGEVHPGASGNTVYLADAWLAPAPDEGAINVNPTFSYGPFNYSGWAAFNITGGPGRLHEIEAGRTVLDTGFSASTTSFPLRSPGTYRIQLKTSCYSRNNTVFLIFLGTDGKEVGRISNRFGRTREEIAAHADGAKEFTSYFTLPKGVERGYFLVYHNMLEELRLTRVGDEKMYKKLAR